MTLDIPPYLLSLTSAAPPVAHAWSQSAAMTALGSETPALLNKLAELSFRSVLGLRAALGEWIVQRFAGLHDDSEHVQVNEAMWAASVDIRYLRRDAMTFAADSVSPIHGPLQLSKTNAREIADLYFKAAFGAVRYTIGSVHLVRYVLTDSKPFDAWFKAVVTRLPDLSKPSARTAGGFDVARKKTEPRGVPNDIFGSPIPREAFDPKFDPASGDMASLIDAMLARISSQPNPFLYTPDELAAMGFKGRAYRYPAD